MSQTKNTKIHNIQFRRLPVLRINMTLIWIEESDLTSKSNKDIDSRLSTLSNCHIFRCANYVKCIKYLKRTSSHERVIIVMNISSSSSYTDKISEIRHYKHVQSVFCLLLVNEQDKDFAIDISTITHDKITESEEVFHDYDSLFVQLQQSTNNFHESDADLLTFLNRPEKALRNLRSELGSYIWSQSYRVVMNAMEYHSIEAKKEMLAICRTCYRDRPSQLNKIEEFKRTYKPVDAIYWYTKPTFLHRIVNTALRTEDNLILYKFRYFIVDLCARLKEAALTHENFGTIFLVYRGAHFRRDEVEKLEVDSLVATNFFFSSSKDISVALRYIGITSDTDTTPSRGREDQHQYVLFEITVDLTESPHVVVADISSLSAIPDENEILFDLGTTFIITNITYDDQCRVWRIQMTSSSEVAKLSQEYNTHIQNRLLETKPIIMFGHITSEMFSNYHQALVYFHRLLRSKSWDDEDRIDIYHYMGRIYRAIEKYPQAITCFHSALLLQRRRLPQSSLCYGRILSCLGSVCYKLGDLSQTKHLYDRAMDIYLRVLPTNHYEFGFHLNRLAQIQWQNKEYQSSLILLQNTLSFVKENMPENSPGQARTLHLMGLVHRSLNNREEAISYFKESLKIRESLLPNNHPYIARTCHELAELYAEQNDYSTAFQYVHRAISIREDKLSLKHSERRQSIELMERLLSQSDTTRSF